jgi:hypothetical protein
MINFINSLTEPASAFVSVFGILYILYYTVKNGFKVGNIIGLFILVCFLSYAVKNPVETINIGREIFKTLMEGG